MPGRSKANTPPRDALPSGTTTLAVPGVLGGGDGGLPAPEARVYQAIRAAIVEHRLPPGTKLAEEELAGIYGISRMRVRRVLLGLSHARLVTLFAGRGAFVGKPSPAEARAVFDARRLLETAVLAEMAKPASPPLLARLRRTIAAGRAATRKHDWAEAIRLSGAFHVHIMAEIGNPVIAGIVEDLVARSSIVLTLYRRGDAPVCRDDDHAEILEALGSGEGFRHAAPLMRHHLNEIEGGLDFSERTQPPESLRSVLLPGKA